MNREYQLCDTYPGIVCSFKFALTLILLCRGTFNKSGYRLNVCHVSFISKFSERQNLVGCLILDKF